jgi:hypothetical protein
MHERREEITARCATVEKFTKNAKKPQETRKKGGSFTLRTAHVADVLLTREAR